jgi:hypothetical protein
MAGLRVSCSCGQPITVPASSAVPASQPSAPAAAQPAPGQPRPVQSAQPLPPKLPDKDWYFTLSGLRFGPLTLADLRSRVQRGDIKRDHMVFHTALGQWTPAGAIAELWAQPATPGAAATADDKWYVSSRGKNYGPYTTARMLEMVSKGQLNRDSVIWSKSIGGWKRLGSIPAFASAFPQTTTPRPYAAPALPSQAPSPSSALTATLSPGAPNRASAPPAQGQPLQQTAAAAPVPERPSEPPPAVHEETASRQGPPPGPAVGQAPSGVPAQTGRTVSEVQAPKLERPPEAASVGEEPEAESMTVENLDALEGAFADVDEGAFGQAADGTEKAVPEEKEALTRHGTASAQKPVEVASKTLPETKEARIPSPDSTAVASEAAPRQAAPTATPTAAPAPPAPPAEPGLAPPPAEPGVKKRGWYYFKGGKREGPLSLEELQVAARQKRLEAKDRVWSPEINQWTEAGAIPALVSVIGPAQETAVQPPAGATSPSGSAPAATAAPQSVSGTKVGGLTFMGSLSRTLLLDKKGAADAPNHKRSDVAHVPSTVLTVEYVDGSEGMDASLKVIEQRLARLEKLITEVHETSSQLVTAVNQQAKDVGALIESLNRRVDRVFRAVSTGVVKATPGAPAPEVPEEQFDIPAQFAGDQEHQEAWRVAQVMASDLEAYYGDKVAEGVLYQNFFELLEGPINEARRTYEERVSEKVRGEFDYFTLALKKLVARKSRELAGGG